MTALAKRILSLSSFVFFLALLLAAAPSLHALDVPLAPTQWLTDRAGLLGPTEADLLNRKLADFEQSTGAQFIIYTFPSLQGDALEEFTVRCSRRWAVGQKKYNNGLILFVFAQDRKARVEVGYGLEGTITDAFSSRVIREQLAPPFQQQQYGAGLNAAADALMAQIRKGEAPVEPMQRRGSGARQRGGDIGFLPILFILFIVFFFIVPMLTRPRYGRRSGCGGCFFPFIFPGGGSGITFGGGGFGGGG
nr:TPM domain-containing protein [Acidobacteriota bacterium]